jgi:hypothetical protein
MFCQSSGSKARVWRVLLACGMIAATVLAVEDAMRASGPPAAGASAESSQGMLAVAGQITPDTHGIFIVDPQNSTMCVYEWVASERKLRLMAARNFAYDRQLDDYNTLPSPREIRTLVEQNRRITATAPAQP